MIKPGTIPDHILRCFWSYDLTELDLDRHKNFIITQVLNYGDWQGVKWLYENYSEDDLKQVIKEPRRGLWFKRALNFWLTVLEIDLPPKEFDRATFR
ncbi:MAG: hypothetical protein J7K02_05495 [Deltaproteobacteria bacterium]|nr:hypothetical protein [Deltaproteobacteria bacterium]